MSDTEALDPFLKPSPPISNWRNTGTIGGPPTIEYDGNVVISGTITNKGTGPVDLSQIVVYDDLSAPAIQIGNTDTNTQGTIKFDFDITNGSPNFASIEAFCDAGGTTERSLNFFTDGAGATDGIFTFTNDGSCNVRLGDTNLLQNAFFNGTVTADGGSTPFVAGGHGRVSWNYDAGNAYVASERGFHVTNSITSAIGVLANDFVGFMAELNLSGPLVGLEDTAMHHAAVWAQANFLGNGGTVDTLNALGAAFVNNGTAPLNSAVDIRLRNPINQSGGTNVAWHYGIFQEVGNNLGHVGEGNSFGAPVFIGNATPTTPYNLDLYSSPGGALSNTNWMRVGQGANGALLVTSGGASIFPATGGNKGAGTFNATNLYINGNPVNSAANAATQSTPANPTGTTDTTGKMMGLAGAITPVVTGRVKMTITGDCFNATAIADGTSIQIRTGTGTAPVNGAALTGSTQGAKVSYIAATTAEKSPFSLTVLVTGLTLGAAIWIDLAIAAITGGTATVENITIVAIEL